MKFRKFTGLVSPIIEPLLSYSLLPADSKRLVLAYPTRGVAGGTQSTIIEFPPDDQPSTFLVALTFRPLAVRLSCARKASPKLTRKLELAAKQWPESNSAVQFGTNARKTTVHTLTAASPAYGGDRFALQAHPVVHKGGPDIWWKPGRGAVCSIASGASLGCAFISAADKWDGNLFNDPLPPDCWCEGDEIFGFSTAVADQYGSYLAALVDYTASHKHELLEYIARTRGSDD